MSSPGGQPLPQTHTEVAIAQRREAEGVRRDQLRIPLWKDRSQEGVWSLNSKRESTLMGLSLKLQNARQGILAYTAGKKLNIQAKSTNGVKKRSIKGWQGYVRHKQS